VLCVASCSLARHVQRFLLLFVVFLRLYVIIVIVVEFFFVIFIFSRFFYLFFLSCERVGYVPFVRILLSFLFLFFSFVKK
jgi:hypothetical protein